jgi:uncharacterized protein YdhG (YjbR/CyaY superfamily)
MRSSAPSVARYIAEQPTAWQPTLKKLRTACRAELAGYTETMSYGMAAYQRRGEIEVAFAKQARYLSLYILRESVFAAHRHELPGLSLGKGCIRYRNPEQMDWDVISRLLSDTCASTDPVR